MGRPHFTFFRFGSLFQHIFSIRQQVLLSQIKMAAYSTLQLQQTDNGAFPYDEHVPDKFSKCIITFEDKRFYYHPGVDPVALSGHSCKT